MCARERDREIAELIICGDAGYSHLVAVAVRASWRACSRCVCLGMFNVMRVLPSCNIQGMLGSAFDFVLRGCVWSSLG